MPLSASSSGLVSGSRPAYFRVTVRAISRRRMGRTLYPSEYHVPRTCRTGAFASTPHDGYFRIHSRYLGITRDTWVCCSIISETRTRYGSRVCRHGRSRPCRAYHCSSFRANQRFRAGDGKVPATGSVLRRDRCAALRAGALTPLCGCAATSLRPSRGNMLRRADRKSTRLNSSHLVISYAVFCLKKKKKRTSPSLFEVIHSDFSMLHNTSVVDKTM